MPVDASYIAKTAATACNEPQPQSPLLIPQDEACRLLGGISRRTLLDLRKKHGLPAVPLMGRTMFDPIDLRNWIEQRKKLAAAGLTIHQPPETPEHV